MSETPIIITTHGFVLHRGDEGRGCGHMEDDCGLGREVRCGYYRKFHADTTTTDATGTVGIR